jgi:mono/diheme cytochrome c family protein
MNKLTIGVAGLLAIGAAWLLTAPSDINPDDFAQVTGNAQAGEQVFWATGCASCHAASDGDPLVLSGGQGLPSAYGTFYAPNISTDPVQGIGGWTLVEFARAIQKGVGREGEHLYPALPYTAYNKLTPQDVADLKAFMDGLPASDQTNTPHDVGFPFNIRRSLGGWKLLFDRQDYVVTNVSTPEETRGRYIAEAMAHCGECHTPRNILGGIKRAEWLAGAPNPDGKGKTPNITPAALTWSSADVVAYLTTGFTPEYDSVGGHMAHVVENMAKLPDSDRAAVAAYLNLITPVPK